jgi:hypothetical protein
MFTESSDFFTLKDLEKTAPKSKGIIQQAVKDVLQSLVDDSLVTCDKIGTSNYYWSLPSTLHHKRKGRVEDLTDKVQVLKRQRVALETARAGREEGAEVAAQREALAKRNAALAEEHARLAREVADASELDPDTLDRIIADAKTAKLAADRWTDNVHIVRGWVTAKFNMDSAEFDKAMGIPEGFDYCE